MINEIIAYIGDYLNKYPLSEPQDVIKLLYQREFGPAHAIQDPERALNWVREEYASCVQEEGCPFEYIGNGWARLDLKRLDANGITPERAAEWFIMSAVPSGDKTSFAGMLKQLAEDRSVVSLIPALPAYIERYVASGCPAVHHSETYRKAYSPAYRVVRPDVLFTR